MPPTSDVVTPVCEGPNGEDLYQCEDAAKKDVCLNECYTLYVVTYKV